MRWKVLFILFLLLISMNYVLAGTVTRTFERMQGVIAWRGVRVNYTSSSGDWSLDEFMPAGGGWEVFDANGNPVSLYSQHLREYFQSGSVITYTFMPPTSGTYTFNQGKYQIGSDNTIWTNFPSQTITVIACTPITEICNNIDDDCDYLVDEDLTQQCGASNIGICRYGTQTCSSGVWGNCVGAVNPQAEICGNDIDENCDGHDSVSNTAADVNCNGCVSNSEFLSYKQKWKELRVENDAFTIAKNKWVTLEGYVGGECA